jgi:2-succinyl-6-hydroxy-2,4-cyclohexadiene-1-carboxylate synthase
MRGSAAVPQTALLLHGFAGTGRMWEPVVERLDAARYRAHAPDLRGHGAAHAARPVDLDAVVGDLVPLLEPAPALLCGYSMGGRIALHIALAAPERVARLVLVATTAGLEQRRADRAAADDALAAAIEAEGLEAFAERWTSGPLFADDPPQARARQREDVLRNTPAGLAAALRGLGQGALPPVWDRLGELDMPVTALAGARDARYVALAERLAAAIPDARAVVVAGAGHGLPREAPDAVATAIGAG